MKHNTIVMLAAAAIILICGCTDPINQKQGPNLDQFTQGPVTINWKGDTKDGIQSYQANVEIYRMNSRRDTAATLSENYRLAVRNINDKVLTRIDFDQSIPMRSIISDGKELVAFNPDTDEIGHRLTIDESESPLMRLFANQTGLSRINLSLIRAEAARISLDMEESNDSGNRTLLLDLPPAMIPQNGYDTITRSRAVFDINDEVLLETEVTMMREDGTIVTTTATPVYEDKDGTPVKVGMVTVIDSKAPGLIEGFAPDMPIYESPDDIPTISQSQLEQMRAAGGVHEIPAPIFGNPADLSYTETVYEVYRDIEINTVPETLFRLIQK